MPVSGKFRNYKYILSLLPGIAVIYGNIMGGWWGMSNLIFSLVILGIVEWFAPEDKSNVKRPDDLLPDLILFLHVPVQITALATLFISINNSAFTPFQLILAAISTGVNSGASAIVIAHELIHRKNRVWQQLGKLLLFTAGNVYFFVEHLRVHHKWVGTEKDPATARYNESVHHFFIRSLLGQLIHAIHLENERLSKGPLWGKMRISFIVLRNYVYRNLILQLVFCGLLFKLTGIIVVLAYLLQILVANFLLEYTNYIEHYGLSRTENERVTAAHSWQSDKVISRFFLIDLSRHSDHHYFASKPYHTLDSHSDSPVLPTGYVTSIYLALIPSLWFSVVNKRLPVTKTT